MTTSHWNATAEETQVAIAHPMDSSRLMLGLLALSNQGHPEALDSAIDSVISADVARRLLSALKHRDASIVRHSRRVAIISTGIARSLGWEQKQLTRLELAALLHDLGKIGICDQILLKPGKFTDEESDVLSVHHRVAVSVLQACGADNDMLQIVAQLHTHYNRAGDDSLQLEGEVHQGARILAVADAYDALTNDRPHRPAFSHSEAMKQLIENSGSRFDGIIVSALGRWFEAEGHAQLVTEPSGMLAQSERPTMSGEDSREAYFFANLFVYLQLLETTYDAYYVADVDGQIRVWNRGAENMFGLSAKHMLGTTYSAGALKLGSQVENRRLTTDESPLMQVLKSELPTLSSLRLQTGRNQWDSIEIQSVPLIDFEGNIRGVLEIVHNQSSDKNRSGEYRKLKMAVTRDPLTSLANRGHLNSQLDSLFENLAESTEPADLSVIFLDIDKFKSINDTHGHDVGDDVLIDLANYLQHETYSGEVVCRYGGEEFVLLCPDTNLDQAIRRAERLRKGIAETEIGGLNVTASLGVSQHQVGDEPADLLKRADQSLYEAKQTGRNKTCWSGDAAGVTDEQSVIAQTDQPVDSLSRNGIYETSFVTCGAGEIFKYKLKGFIDEFDARVDNCSDKGGSLLVGQRSLFGGSLPVKVDFEFGQERHGMSSRQVELNVRISPQGRLKTRDHDRFLSRCQNVVRDLRSYVSR